MTTAARNNAIRPGAAPYHPDVLPRRYPATPDELEALMARGRMLRARALHALVLRLRRRLRRALQRARDGYRAPTPADSPRHARTAAPRTCNA